MKNSHHAFTRSCIAVAIVLAFPADFVLADEVQALTSPNVSEFTLHGQDLNAVNPDYRESSGLNRAGVLGSLDINVVNRNPEGEWFTLQGRNLGLPGIQEGNASYEKQGDWRVGLGYNEITHYAPYTLNTKVGGIGTGTINLNPDFRSNKGLGPEADLSLHRTATSLGATKSITDHLKFNFSIKAEKKEGAVMSSSEGNSLTGLTPANSGVPVAGKTYATTYFAPQPENYQHNQLNASFDYFTKKFQIDGGYYGSFFNNANTALNVRPGQADPAVAGPTLSSQTPWIALPPNNHSQQLYLNSAYHFSDSTHGSFKATVAQGVQDAAFIPNVANSSVLNPSGVAYAPGITNSNLGAVVNTSTLAGRVTSKLNTNLDLMGSWRFENRQDATPIRQYITGGNYNVQESWKRNNGKLELNYRVNDDYRMIGGVDYNQKSMPFAVRTQTHETVAHAELRKSMSETLNGSLLLSHGVRGGGSWNLAPVDLSGATVTFPTATNVAAPIEYSDRTEDKIKAMVDWNPITPLSLQFYYEHNQDKYTSAPEGPASGNYPLTAMGLLNGKTDLFGVDATYMVNKDWKLNGYYSYNQNKTHQNELQTPRPSAGVQTCAGSGVIAAATNTLSSSTTCVPWAADLDMNGQVFGAGVKGRVGTWHLEGKYLLARDATSYNITYTGDNKYSQTAAGAGVLPNTVYLRNRLHLSGVYDYNKDTKIRLDMLVDVLHVNDYTWTGWTFSDGTQVNMAPTQKTYLMGVSITRAF